jgi:hypothetical protein
MPAPVEDVATVDRLQHTYRGVRRSDPRVVVGAPDLLLDARVAQRHLPRVYADDAGHPAGRAVEGGDAHDGLGEVARVRLGAAVLRRLEHLDDPGVAEDLRGRVVELAELLVGLTEGRELLGPLLDCIQDGVHDLTFAATGSRCRRTSR